MGIVNDRHFDEAWMERALSLAARGVGHTSPNPSVGAVVVRQNRVAGEGYHHKAGGPHAEVLALRAAGGQSRGATLFVTLEPCSTFGRTPPCTDLIIESGVSRVVVGTRDPNPRHNGCGIRLLRKAGVEVAENVLAGRCASMIAPFAKWITTGMPYVTLKMAMSLDGKIADIHGKSKWITSDKSRSIVQTLRRSVDAILIGRRTAQLDDPSLTCRNCVRQPFRIVADSRCALPLDLKLLTDGNQSRTIIATTRLSPRTKRNRVEATGAKAVILPETRKRVCAKALMRELGRRQILHVLCEGGSELVADLIANGLVDEYLFFVGAVVLGGRSATPAVGGTGFPLARCRKIMFTSCEMVGGDLLIRARPKD